MIVKLQNGDKIKVESDEKREARRKYKEHSLLSIGLKLKRNLNIASNFLKSGPNITNFGNAVSALFGGFSPENPDVTKGDPPAVGIKNFENLVRTARIAREFEKAIASATKNGRLEVTSNYFNSPNNWYRITETPEKFGIMEQGKNVTTTDATLTVGTINGWRSSMLKAPVTKGTGKNEGYFIKKPPKIDINIRRKNGQAHGNTSQAAKGKLWGGTTSGSNLFPEGVIEGQAPSMINYGIDRTNFVITPWELIPNGGRVGFHTGEMPMSNLGWFLKTKNGTYTYEPIIPEKRILVLPISKITKSKPYIRWSQKGYLNEAYNIEGGPGQKFIVVKDVDNPLPGVLNTKGNGEYSLHFHSTRDNPNKEKMFQALAESIPEGEKVSTWGTISKGGYHGINRFGELFGWTKVGERPAVNGPVNIFLKPYTDNRYKREDVLIGDEWGADLYSYPEYVQHRINKIKKASPNIIGKYNPEEFDHLYILDSDFTPMAKMNIGANMKGLLSEIIRRLNSLYKDVPLEVNTTIKLLGDVPFVIGYFNNPGHTGAHNIKRNLSLVDPVPKTNLLSSIMHEHIMHGTDKWMTNSIAEKYLKFVDPIISNTNGTYKWNGWTYKIPEGTNTWYEGRATLGEIRKSMYDKLAKSKGIKISPETIELLRPEFEKIIDDLTIEEASELLTKTGGYGEVYGRLGSKNNPKFLLQFKYLMKVAPATIPFLIPRKEEKK